MKRRKQTAQSFSEHYIPYILTVFYFKPLFYTLDFYNTIIKSFIERNEKKTDKQEEQS